MTEKERRNERDSRRRLAAERGHDERWLAGPHTHSRVLTQALTKPCHTNDENPVDEFPLKLSADGR